MNENKKGIAPLIALIVVVIFAFFVIYSIQSLQPKPPVEIKISIDPSSIQLNQFTRIKVTIKNLDLKTHDIRFVFDSSPRVTILAGSERVLLDNTYMMKLDATDVSEERVFTATASLEEKVSSTVYPITLKVYVDGNELKRSWDNLSLKVTR